MVDRPASQPACPPACLTAGCPLTFPAPPLSCMLPHPASILHHLALTIPPCHPATPRAEKRKAAEGGEGGDEEALRMEQEAAEFDRASVSLNWWMVVVVVVGGWV